VFAACDIGVFGVAGHRIVAPLALTDGVKVGKAVGSEIATFVLADGVVALALIAVGRSVRIKAVICAANRVLIKKIKYLAFTRDFAIALLAGEAVVWLHVLVRVSALRAIYPKLLFAMETKAWFKLG
jgi:hypothetical protein